MTVTLTAEERRELDDTAYSIYEICDTYVEDSMAMPPEKAERILNLACKIRGLIR